MPGYHYHRHTHKHIVRWRRAHRALLGLLLLFIIVGAIAATYFWQQGEKVNSQPETSKQLGVYYAKPQRQYENEVFKFNSSKEWQFSASGSALGTQYTYFSQSVGLIKYELKIFLDGGLKATPVNYILPVTVQNGAMVAGTSSPRCAPKNPNQIRVDTGTPQAYGKINFYCELLTSKESVAIGLDGQGYNVPMYNSKGQLKLVNMQLIDHSDKYYIDTLTEIVNSFKLK